MVVIAGLTLALVCAGVQVAGASAKRRLTDAQADKALQVEQDQDRLEHYADHVRYIENQECNRRSRVRVDCTYSLVFGQDQPISCSSKVIIRMPTGGPRKPVSSRTLIGCGHPINLKPTDVYTG
jgi:hypothetical protein